ncbi:MAG: FadR/GntR family transcriptional regulator [Terriglobia bacterium]
MPSDEHVTPRFVAMSPNQTTSREEVFEVLSPNASLVERARQQLESLILNGSLPPGKRLPTERKLGEMLGVSRTVVRESMRLLSAAGLVKVTTGSGTYVQGVGPSIVRDSLNLLLRASHLTPEQIYEVRSVLEINVAGLAAQRAGVEEIAAMAEENSALVPDSLPATEYARHDLMFHIRLAESTRNPLFLSLIHSLSTVTIRTMWQMYAASHETSKRQIRTDEHSAILERVKVHDVEGARQAMSQHMVGSLERLREAQLVIAVEQAENSIGS